MNINVYIDTFYVGTPPEEEAPGVYILGFADSSGSFVPAYVGRSDVAVVSRARQNVREMCEDQAARFASHWCFRTFDTAEEAYAEECLIYHIIAPTEHCQNDAHPDRPFDSSLKCPIPECPQ